MNPELEPKPQLVECPHCEGVGILYPKEPMMRACCPVCDGQRTITQDAADHRDSAAEAAWESNRGK